jgi:hypothetical protein
MVLIKDAYFDCFLYEDSSLAHYIHHLLEEKKVSLEDEFETI